LHGARAYYVYHDTVKIGHYGLLISKHPFAKEFIMSPTLIDLSAVAVAGIALTGAILSFALPRAHMAPAGEPGFTIEMALESEAPVRTAATTRFGGSATPDKSDPSWASFPRAF